MLLTVVLLLGSACLIYLGCELFVNGVEWLGRKLGIAQNAVGTILAAFGTALPESVVTFVAVVFGREAAQKDIGVGAALGGPLVLSTLTYAVTAWSIYFFRGRRAQGTTLVFDSKKLGCDQLAFLVIFLFKVALGFLVFPGKPLTGLLFLAAYGVYFWRELRSEGDPVEGVIDPLRFQPHAKDPTAGWIWLQTAVALGAVFIGSQVFVGQLETLGHSLGVPGHVIALLLSPVATELPETLNVVIWVRQGKERLALANVSGAMMIQATVPTALGLLFTPWQFDTALAIAAGATIVSIGYLLLTLRTGRLTTGRLAVSAVGYLLFAGLFLLTLR
jgi:cation:H+ antiporter